MPLSSEREKKHRQRRENPQTEEKNPQTEEEKTHRQRRKTPQTEEKTIRNPNG